MREIVQFVGAIELALLGIEPAEGLTGISRLEHRFGRLPTQGNAAELAVDVATVVEKGASQTVTGKGYL
jgi:hypothetical protein